MNKPTKEIYCALMIRAWQEPGRSPEQDEWCFRVRDLTNGDQRGFASLEALLDFLKHKFGKDSTNLA